MTVSFSLGAIFARHSVGREPFVGNAILFSVLRMSPQANGLFMTPKVKMAIVKLSMLAPARHKFGQLTRISPMKILV